MTEHGAASLFSNGSSTRRHAIALSRRAPPEFCSSLHALQTKGAGKAGCRLAPAVRCARCSAEGAAQQHTGDAEHTAFPAQWLDGLYRALPGAEFLLASLALRNSPAPRRLAPVPRPQDLAVATTARTTRFCRTPAFRLRQKASPDIKRRSYNAACKALTGFGSIHRPALRPASATALPASTAAQSAARDDVRPPLFAGSGWAEHTTNPNFGKVEYFDRQWLTERWGVLPVGYHHIWVIPGRATWREPGIHLTALFIARWILRCAIAHHSSRYARPGMTGSSGPSPLEARRYDSARNGVN